MLLLLSYLTGLDLGSSSLQFAILAAHEGSGAKPCFEAAKDQSARSAAAIDLGASALVAVALCIVLRCMIFVTNKIKDGPDLK